MPSIALSMIVRNAATDIARCLASVRGIVDDILVGDTGSTDDTPEIARQYGAQVISISWENDFAAARNIVLAAVRNDWILVLDADEMLDPSAGISLPRLLRSQAADGFQVPIRNYVRKLEYRLWDRVATPNDSNLEAVRGFPAYIEHQNVRLFRRDPEISFVGRIHETVGWRLQQAGKRLETANFVIHHFGLAADAPEQARKAAYYRELGKQKVADMPGNAQAHLEMGLAELDQLHNPAEALKWFAQACDLSPLFALAWFFSGVAHCRLAQYDSALQCLDRAESCGYRTPWASEMRGDANYNLGRFPAAMDDYRNAFSHSRGNQDLESKCGLAQVRAGYTRAGLKLMRSAISKDSGNSVLHDRLIQATAWLGDLRQAAEAAEKKLASVSPRAEDFLRAASIRARAQEWDAAAKLVRAGLDKHSDSHVLRKAILELEQMAASSRSA